MPTVPMSPLPIPFGAGEKYYRHSGQLNARGLLAGVVGGLVTAAVLGWAYALCDHYIPEIKLNAIACIGLGMGLGLVPAEMLRRLKVRSLTATTAITLLSGVAGLYVAWAAWEWLLFKHATPADFLKIAGRPQVVVAIARDCYETGTWRLSKSDAENTKGVFLGVIWAIEALTILGLAVGFGRSLLRARPFCERCDQWCGGPTVVRRTAWAEPADVRRKLEAGDFASVTALGPPDKAKYLEFTRYTCGTCGQMNTLSAATRTVTTDKRGRTRGARSKRFVENLLVTPADLQKITPPPPPTPSVAAAAAALRGGR